MGTVPVAVGRRRASGGPGADAPSPAAATSSLARSCVAVSAGSLARSRWVEQYGQCRQAFCNNRLHEGHGSFNSWLQKAQIAQS